ncbi:MAG TPA: MarR family transcriptional regulator [Tepidiformaceae bacterium]|jgi:DNA-binding MarR family transcriptional regulator
MPQESESLFRFRKAYWQVVRELDTERLREWERSHLTLPQLRVLFQIRRTPGITTGELSRTLGVTVSTTSGLVIKLADRSLVRRDSVEGDRRQSGLFLTEEAEVLVSEISEAWRPFLARVGEALGPDLEAVTATFEQVAEAAASVRETAESERSEIAVP